MVLEVVDDDVDRNDAVLNADVSEGEAAVPEIPFGITETGERRDRVARFGIDRVPVGDEIYEPALAFHGWIDDRLYVRRVVPNPAVLLLVDVVSSRFPPGRNRLTPYSTCTHTDACERAY